MLQFPSLLSAISLNKRPERFISFDAAKATLPTHAGNTTMDVSFKHPKLAPPATALGLVYFGHRPNYPLGKTALEQALFAEVHRNTPYHIFANPLLDMSNPKAFTFKLTSKMLQPYDPIKNPTGLGLDAWLKNYKKEADVSTAGIRGQQNILYPWDTRFPINLVGVLLATTAKAQVARELYGDATIHKLAASEVRYNSPEYLDLIARAQAAHGITTLVPRKRVTIPIGLTSFLTFKLDLLGGEYLTSSHGISTKLATKDLNNQGSQYLPDESKLFVKKIEDMFAEAKEKGSIDIPVAAKDSPYIREDVMRRLHNGIDLYTQYLRDGVATDYNLDQIRGIENKMILDNIGGSAYRTTGKILKRLGIENSFRWFRTKEDPFFHQVGKANVSPKGVPGFYDWSADTTITKVVNGQVTFPVIETMGYAKRLKNVPTGTVIQITDPDHDRLITTQIESKDRVGRLKELGLDFVPLDENRVLTVYTPNQSFLMIMDAWMKQLKASGQWDEHPRFIIKTTASAMAWDEWAKNNGIRVVNTPVGFKELANIMKKVEFQMQQDPSATVKVQDVFGQWIDLGVNPRMVAAGEESGGIVIGPEKMIESMAGRKAISLREKGAAEPIIILGSLAAQMEKQNQPLSEYLGRVFEENNIKGRYDIRVDVNYYNESQADPDQLKKDKEAGEQLRTKNDMFYLSMAMANREGKLDLDQVKAILNDTFKAEGLDFSDLTAIRFVGDGTYLEFPDKYIEIRPSGTDAKTKAYGAGLDKGECTRFATIMGNYSGDRTPLHQALIPQTDYETVKDRAMDVYTQWSVDYNTPERQWESTTVANFLSFKLPDYSQTYLKGFIGKK